MGRPFTTQPAEIIQWRQANEASIKQTAEHFGVSIATVKRAATLLQEHAGVQPTACRYATLTEVAEKTSASKLAQMSI